MQITRATPNDAPILTQIAFAAKRHWGYSEKWIEGWRDVLTIRPDLITEQPTYTARLESRIVGFYALAVTDQCLELLHLWVLPDAMGQGVGRALFNHAITQSKKKLGYKALRIESDPNATGFYERMGARRTGVIAREVDHHPRELPVLVYDLADDWQNRCPA